MSLVWKRKTPGHRLPPTTAMHGLRHLVEASPDKIRPRLALARTLFGCGRLSEIAALFPGPPDAIDPSAAFEVGRAAAHLGDIARAIPVLERAAAADIPKAHGELARALLRAHRDDEAVAAAREALARSPGDSQALRTLCAILFRRGEAQEAYNVATSLWYAGVRNAQVVWTRACAAGALGRVEEFSHLTSPERFFLRAQLDAGEDFNRALEDEVRAQGELALPAPYKPTRDNVLRHENFETAGGPAAGRFHEFVRREVSRYWEERKHLADHPTITGRPDAVMLESWALVMAATGYEDWHIHPAAWLSGVYYLDVPRCDRATTAGRIGFGALPAAPRLKGCAFPTWQIAPEPGTLILFPAHFAHRTWPTESPQPRVSIAFNAIEA